ncbi:MAG: two-component regulator propeller domain-containing protein [Saprospiraceae bacterium]
MKKYPLHMQHYPLLLLFFFITSCNGQNTPPQSPSESNADVIEPKTILVEQPKIYGPVPDPFPQGQVSQYIRRMFQDKNGDLWFGTNGDGVCRFDGKSLAYFTPTEGFGGHAVRGIVEDEGGNLWFATNGGVCRYDISRANHPCNNNSCKHDPQIEQDLKAHSQELAKSFTKYTMMDGLSSDEVWSILLDRDGNIWCGTEGGVCRFHGLLKIITNFPITPVELTGFPDAYQAPKLVNCIFQDKTGNLWFGSNGNGVYRYDGTSLTNISEKEGLCNNFVQCILEDKNGNLWFGTRFGGLSRYDPATGGFTNFTTKHGLCCDFVWTMMEEKNVPTGETEIWVCTAGGGACRYNEKAHSVSFSHFTTQAGSPNRYVQSILRDKNGTLWLGTSGGLFRYDGKSFINVTRIGPWR